MPSDHRNTLAERGPSLSVQSLWGRLGGLLRWAKKTLPFLGPAYLISVGYMDPGNWATDIAGGSAFGYRLLWVLLLSNLMALLLQTLSAKLGIATGKTLAELCRDQFPKPVSRFLWVTAELAMISTDLAEFLGSAIGLHLLFRIPLFTAVLITGLDVFLILGLARWGFRAVEFAIMAMVVIVGWSYVAELFLSQPDWWQAAFHTVVPQIDGKSLFIAIGMLGATVMPHNLYLHSALVQTRRAPRDPAVNRRLYKATILDTVLALNTAWFINSAILMMAAAVFYKNGLTAIDGIEEAHQTLAPLLGPAASTVFAIALLAAGISSSTTGTMAGQVVMEGFLHIRWAPWVRRLITRGVVMVPAALAIYYGMGATDLLVLSQVILSFQLPFATIPLLLFTRRKDLMGEFVNNRWTNVAATAIISVVIVLNVALLYLVFAGAAW